MLACSAEVLLACLLAWARLTRAIARPANTPPRGPRSLIGHKGKAPGIFFWEKIIGGEKYAEVYGNTNRNRSCSSPKALGEPPD